MSDRQRGSWALKAARALVGLGALVAPGSRRREWREEWDAEIWHYVNEQGRSARKGAASAALVLRCMGAVPHALWIRAEEWNMDTLVQDARFALRTLARRPVFALVAIITLALGIGGNTAVFSVVNAVLLRPLPIHEADRLVWIWGREFNGTPTASVSPPDFVDYDAGTQAVFEELGAYTSFSGGVVYDGGDRPVELYVRGVTHDFLSVLGEEPALGRSFTEEETRAAEAGPIMISHGLWGRLFGFDGSVVGQSIALDGTGRTIVGVLPEAVTFPSGDVWEPLTFGAEWYGLRSAHFLRPLGLLREGVPLEQAREALDGVSARLEAAYPETNDGWYAIPQSLQSVFVGSVRPALLVLLAAIGAVLLIACGNVANLLLARSASRRGEVALRSAIGATRGRIVRQLMTESLILAGAGGLVGLLVARAGLAGLVLVAPANLPRMSEVGLDGTVLLFTLAVSLLVGVLFGTAPALGLSGRGLHDGVRSASRGNSVKGRRFRSALIAGEVALSFVLLAGALLLTRSFVELRSVDPGFDPEGVVGVSLTFSERDEEERVVALDGVLERVRALPGVTSAGAITSLPFSGSGGDTYVYWEDDPPEQIRNIQNTAFIRTIDEAYFATLDMRVVRGRSFDVGDAVGTTPRVVINQALATRLFGELDPLGKRMVAALDTMTALEVVGVVEDARQFNLGTPASAEFFLSTRQYPRESLQLVARGLGGASPSLIELREAIWEVDPSQPLARTASLDDMVGASLAPGRFQALLIGLFSALAVVLSGVGLYGVLAEGVNEQRREIGVRMAMGAEPSLVVRRVVAHGARVVGAGILMGGVIAFASGQVLASLLYGVTPRDPLSFALTPLFLVVVAMVASWLPAFQAARVDPVQALKADG